VAYFFGPPFIVTSVSCRRQREGSVIGIEHCQPFYQRK